MKRSGTVSSSGLANRTTAAKIFIQENIPGNVPSVSYKTLRRWAERDAFNHVDLHKDLNWTSSSHSSDTNDEQPLSPAFSWASSVRAASEDISLVSMPSPRSPSVISDQKSCAESDSSDGNSDKSVCERPDFLVQVESDDDDDDDKPYVISNSATSDEIPTLHSSTSMTVDESVMKFVMSYLRNQKTKSCLKEDLNFLLSVLPKPNHMPVSLFKLFKHVKRAAPSCSVSVHYCCKTCSFYVGENVLQLCSACNSDAGYIPFYELSIVDQISYLFNHRDLATVIRRASASRNRNPNIISDITDGAEYKRVNANRNELDCTLMLSTDGAVLKKSSSKSNLWPLSFMIAEVPPSLRRCFTLCVGIWYAEKKPEMNSYLMPFCMKLRTSFNDGGFEWFDHPNNTKHQIKIYAPLIVADAPARAMVLNMQNHNGKYGCQTCEVKTKRTKRILGERRRRVYKFSENGSTLRTKERMLAFGREAESSHSIIKGIKGRSIVSLLPGADESTLVFAEFMHVLCLGVIKQVINLWTTKPGPWSLKECSMEIDTFLVNIRPPNFFCRFPRGLSEIPHWKAYEFLYFAEFYSLLALKNYLPTRYYQHWMLLVIAINKLLQEKIQINPDLETTDSLLRRFVREFEELYGEKELSYNLHQLIHISVHIKRWGPVWGNSAFGFEDFIGTLGKSIHGHNKIGKEIIRRTKLSCGVQFLKEKLKLQSNFVKHNNSKCLGRAIAFEFSQNQKYLLDLINLPTSNVSVHTRALIKGKIFSSSQYKLTKSLNYCVHCKVGENSELFGKVRIFLEYESNIFFFLDPFLVDQERILYHGETRAKVEHIIPVKDGGPSQLIDIRNVTSMIKMLLYNNEYVCTIPKSITNRFFFN